MSGRRIRSPWLLVIALAVLLFSVGGAYVIAELPGGATARCVDVGPSLKGPLGPEWEPFEAITVRGSFQWWPMGRSCLWTAASGEPSSRAEPDPVAWVWTILAMGSGVVAAAAATRLVRRTSDNNSRTQVR